MPAVSIIVPVFRVERYLKKCLDSLIGQTFKDIEIVLVDDGSDDHCPDICNSYAAADPRIIVIHKENGGVGAARNDGLAAASGSYVIFCDSDDWMERDGIERLYKKARTTDADIVIGDVYLVTETGKKLVRFYERNFSVTSSKGIEKLIKADIYRTYCPIPPKEGPAFGYGGPWNKLVRKSLLEKNFICFDTRLKGVFDDIIYTAYIMSKASKIVYYSIPVYNYRILANSITHTYKENVLDMNRTIFDTWNEFFASLGNPVSLQKPFYACVMRRIDEAMALYFINSDNPKDKRTLKQELDMLAKEEPYRTAVRNVDLRKITKKQVMLALLGRVGLLRFVFLAKRAY